jgi:hypothetical protein
MHHIRIATFLLGAWLLGSLFMAFVATENFATVDRLLKSPQAEASRLIQMLGHEDSRRLLRHLAGEQNRGFFESWELAQLVLGAMLIVFLVLGGENWMLAGLAGAMLILTAFQHLKITPEMVWLGRAIDFVPWTADSLSRDQFWKLHGVYGAIEGVKLVFALVLAGFLFPMRRRSRRRVDVNPVDYANHRHVNR